MKPKVDRKNSDVAAWLEHVRQDEGLREGLGDLAALKGTSVVKLAAKLALGKEIDEKRVAEQLGIPRDRLERAMRALASFFLNLPAEALKPYEAISALASEAIIPKRIEPKLTRLVRDVSSRTSWHDAIRNRFAEKSAADPTLPRMRGIWTRCLLVASYAPEYKADDDVAAYAPKVRGFIPLVSLQIDVDVFGTLERFSVGLSQDELARLINRLRLAERQFHTMLADTRAKRVDTAAKQGSQG
jgi:hypothetical protein